MSFPSALQSAVFYLLACTPCTKVRHRHKARERAKRERAEKALFESEQPDVYRHPSPFHTNQFWSEEISMGPSLPKKATSKNPSQRRLASSSSSNCRHSSASAVFPPFSLSASLSNSPNLVSSSFVATSDKLDPLTDDWNKKPYQRQDEELWGQWPGQRWMDALVKAGSSAGRLIEATLRIDRFPTYGPYRTQDMDDSAMSPEARNNFYYLSHHRNPPVNDYHPPVVSSRPIHLDAHCWMLQPPPPAKVMEGKVPVRYSAAMSTLSTSSGRPSVVASQHRLDPNALAPAFTLAPAWIDNGLTEEQLIASLTRPTPTLSRRSSIMSSHNCDSSADDSTPPPLSKVSRRTRLSSRQSCIAQPCRAKVCKSNDYSNYIPDDKFPHDHVANDGKDDRFVHRHHTHRSLHPHHSQTQPHFRVGMHNEESSDEDGADVNSRSQSGHAALRAAGYSQLDRIASFNAKTTRQAVLDDSPVITPRSVSLNILPSSNTIPHDL